MTDLELFNLQGNSKLRTLHFTDDDDWLELRRAGIGGSDIGALMGLNKYSSPLKVYRQKVEGWKEDMSDNVYVKKGHDLEDFILTRHVQEHMAKEGYAVGKPDFMIINDDFPYLRANVDGIAYRPGKPFTDNIIVEIKWVSEWAQVNWDGPDYRGIPASYYAQVQLYMCVTGALQARLFALFDKDWEVKEYVIPRDEMFILSLKATAKKFYEVNMGSHIPPMLSTEIDKEEVVKAIEAAPVPDKPNADMSKYVAAYLELSANIKEAEKRKARANDLILEMYRQGYYPDDPTLSVKLSTVTSKRFNSTRFKEDNPELYEQYSDESSSARFTIKKK